MTIDKLYDLKDNSIVGEKDRTEIALLLQAITEWPIHVETVETFLNEIKGFLNTDHLSYETISKGIKKLNSEDFLWEIEALSSLLDLVEIRKDVDLEVVLQKYCNKG